MAISQRSFEITSAEGAGVACYLAVPDGGSGPGLLLLHDSDGLNDHAKHLANLYAEEGWVVASPDLGQQTDAEFALQLATTALSALAAVAETSGDIGVLGHGPGARLALLLASCDVRVRCAVGYYPADLHACGAALARIDCPVLLHLGTDTEGKAAVVPDELVANDSVEIRRYAARDGFDNPNLTSYHRAAHWSAKSRTLTLLRAKLGPIYDLEALWEAHLFSEFADRNVDVSMATMVDEPYVFVVPTVTGGTGKRDLHRWYSDHFHFQNPPDTTVIPISRTVGTDSVVDEFIFCFTHDRAMDWILPGIAPTGKYVEVPMTAVVNFRGPKLYHEHIAWDQATVLVQTGLLDPTGLPVTGIEQSKAMQDEALPRNRLIAGWS